MAMMDRARSMFNGMVKRERYSRFTLQPTEDGERHAEVKLSDDATDDATEMEAGGSPSFRPAPLQKSHHTVLYMALGTVLVFVFGFLIGYIGHGQLKVESANCSTGIKMATQTGGTPGPVAPVTPAPVAPEPEVQLDWSDITQLLKTRLTREVFEKTLREFALPSRSAGSREDSNQGDSIFNEFKKLEMEPWFDRHYVQLQTPDSNRRNRVEFGSYVFQPAGYLAYSATDKVKGKLVYGNYGRPEDLKVLQKNNVTLNGSVLLLRAGNISFAEKVFNAAQKKVSAVLIYPDPQDYSYLRDTELYGHVHLGSGDPYTPGFPSFKHTQFAATNSSGLPQIPAQTITANNATALLQKIGGPEPDENSWFKGGLKKVSYNLGGIEDITVEVNNVPVNREIHNVFGVIKGFTDPDRYVVLGAQRDAWGEGYAQATVGTAILMGLARAVHEMVENDGFRPRRSIVFASWSAGEYGSVGATEWLEAHMSSIDRNVFAYINLDGAVLGRGSFMASASPLLYSLLESTMKEVESPVDSRSMYDMMGKDQWKTKVLRPMAIDDPAYPFLAFGGIPSVSFHFVSPNSESYTYYDTKLDNRNHLDYQTNQRTGEITAAAAQFAGQMALRLVHDHLLSLDVRGYMGLVTKTVTGVYRLVRQLSQSGQLKDVSPTWLTSARGSFERAANSITNDIQNTDLSDNEACRILNNRLMRVEHTLLSPYVSPVKTPFRHILLGRGTHTLASIAETTDMEELRTQLALATWSLQGCANAMVGNIWELDDEI